VNYSYSYQGIPHGRSKTRIRKEELEKTPIGGKTLLLEQSQGL
jgi:hypothetical protein